MLRIYVSLAVNLVESIRVGTYMPWLEDVCTRLKVNSDAQRGFYFEINHSIKDCELLVLRNDIKNITSITHHEVTDDSVVFYTGCGNFTCENGTVKISEAKGQGGKLEIFIVAKTVDDFNKVIDALRNGELKKDGEELTVFEILSQQLSDIKNRNLFLEVEQEDLRKTFRSTIEGHEENATKDRNRCWSLESFIYGVADYVGNIGTLPKSMNDVKLDRLIFEVTRLKNRSLWQRIWNK